ncbi:MAG TPA: hypothetical protein VEJ63_08940 [Planctomycetota bacterium]|nr:hypothetical protein [Planctomycetota bacterium]
MRTTSLPGALDECVLDFSFSALPGGGSGVLAFRPDSGYGDRVFGVYVNGRRATHVSVAEGQPARVPLALPPESGPVALLLEDLGDWADDSYDPDEGALSLEALSADRLSLTWYADPEIVSRGVAAALSQLSTWSLSGLKRFSNGIPLPGRATRAQLEARLDVNGATRTVSLYAGNVLIAQGSRNGDGSVALSAQNQSGINGSVTVAASSGIAAGQYTLELRFPGSYEIHYSTAALTFPRAAEMTVLDDGRSNRFRAVTPVLPAGAYNVAVVSVSDTGVRRSTISTQSVTVAAPPTAPANLAYDSGSAAATVIRFDASATPGATHCIYDSAINAPINMQSPAGTHAAGSGTLFQALSAIAGYPGIRRVIVRAVNSGVEEQNLNVLQIEYDASGNVIGARPNVPRIRGVSVSAGRLITVKAVYFAAQQAAAPQTAQLFIAADGSPINYASPVDTQAWSEDVGGIRVVTLTTTAPSDGFFTVAVLAVSAASVQNNGTETERIHVSNAEPTAAANVSAIPARA